MNKKPGYKLIPLTFNRKAVIASATATKKKNTFHCITEVDTSVPCRLISEYFQQTGVKLSLTAYIVTCLARVIKYHPLLNSFIKGNKITEKEHLCLTASFNHDIVDGAPASRFISQFIGTVKSGRFIIPDK